MRLLEAGDEQGRYGLYFDHGPGGRTTLTLAADGSGLIRGRGRDAQRPDQRSSLRALGPGFRGDAYHRLLVSARGGELEVRVDGVCMAAGIEAPSKAGGVGLLTWAASAAFDGVSLTPLAGR